MGWRLRAADAGNRAGLVSDRPVRFWHRGGIVAVPDVAADTTVLQWLREDARLTGTKEGCGEGDCGACTVIVGELEGTGLRRRAVNSCLRLLSSLDGRALWTIEDVADPVLGLHPAQAALVDEHGSQCGFCTPGVVMSLVAAYDRSRDRGRDGALGRAEAASALSGNLCRCTGYRSILAAAAGLGAYPARGHDDAPVVAALRDLASDPPLAGATMRPRTVRDLVAARHEHPDARLVAGGTDLAVRLAIGAEEVDRTLDVTAIPELARVEPVRDGLLIGAAVRLSDAFDALDDLCPDLADYWERFGGNQIREEGTLVGNIANASPVGDSLPVLLVLHARLRLASMDGLREAPLEGFLLGPGRTALGADEVITHVLVPGLPAGERVCAWKISKRRDDDISTVSLAARLRVRGGIVEDAALAAGGVAATPVRLPAAEEALRGAAWTAETVAAAARAASDEVGPIDDLRGSAAYRRQALGALVTRLWPVDPEPTGGAHERS